MSIEQSYVNTKELENAYDDLLRIIKFEFRHDFDDSSMTPIIDQKIKYMRLKKYRYFVSSIK